MKKLTSLFPLLLMAMMAVAFTSCTDEDEYEAYTLEGAWRGDMGVVVVDDYGYAYESTLSEIYFDRDPYRYASGVGYQIDYFGSASPWYHDRSRNYYLANHFDWKVVNGIIQIYYREDDVYAEIRDYDLSYERFHGYIDYEDGSSSEFWLNKTSSPNDYEHYYEWGYYEYFYGKGNALGFEDATRAAGAEAKQVKRYRTAKKENFVEK